MIEGGGHPRDQWRGFGTGPAALLLVPPERVRDELRAALHEQQPDALRPAELVGRRAQSGNAEVAEVHGNLADRLRRVAVQRHPRG